MKKSKNGVQIDQVELALIRLKIMGLGGVSRAAKKLGFGYWRLSRTLNGWVNPTDEELRQLEDYVAREATADSLLKQAQARAGRQK